MHRRDLLKTLPFAGARPAWAAVETLSGKGRLRPALCAYSFREALARKTMTYPDVIRLCADLNLDGADLTVYWFPDTGDSFLMPLRRLAYRMGVAIYSISIRTNLCQPTAELRAKELAAVRKWVDVAARLGAGHIRVFGGDVPPTNTEAEAIGWVSEILARAAEYAGSHGVILGLENHGGITEKAENIVTIVQTVGSPWVGVNLDTGNFRTRVYEQIAALIPYAVNVQVKVDVREDGVQKESDWDRIAGMLARSGYKGYLALEYEAKEPAATAVPRLCARLRQVTQRHSAPA